MITTDMNGNPINDRHNEEITLAIKAAKAGLMRAVNGKALMAGNAQNVRGSLHKILNCSKREVTEEVWSLYLGAYLEYTSKLDCEDEL